MKIGVVQTRPVLGDISANITQHMKLIESTVSLDAELVIFPELSVTGYTPSLANDLAIEPNHPRFEVFQLLSNMRNISIGIGAPTRSEQGICISLLLYQPHQPVQVFSKKHLHADEEKHFVPSQHSPQFLNDEAKAVLAICYEITVPEHAATAARNGARIYVASVAKTDSGIESSIPRLSQIAFKYSMTVLMANCVGPSEEGVCAGRSSVWDRKGDILAQLDSLNEGLIVLDTKTHEFTTALSQY